MAVMVLEVLLIVFGDAVDCGSDDDDGEGDCDGTVRARWGGGKARAPPPLTLFELNYISRNILNPIIKPLDKTH